MRSSKSYVTRKKRNLFSPAILAFALLQDPAELNLEDLAKAQPDFAGTHFKNFPPTLQKLLGRWVAVEGYIAPVFVDGEIEALVLSRDIRDPAIGLNPKPDPFSSTRVEFRKRPDEINSRYLVVSGRFSVKVVIRDGEPETLFLLAEAVEGRAPPPAEGEEPAGEPGLLRFSTLLRARRHLVGSEEEVRELPKLPAEVRALDGRWVTLAGYLLVPGAVPDAREFVVARDPWDGCCMGKPPTIFDSVLVRLDEGESIQAPYPPLVTVSGRLRVTPKIDQGLVASLYHLEAARLGAQAEGGGDESYLFRILLIPASLLLAAAGTLFLLRRMRIAPPDRIK